MISRAVCSLRALCIVLRALAARALPRLTRRPGSVFVYIHHRKHDT